MGMIGPIVLGELAGSSFPAQPRTARLSAARTDNHS